MDQFKRYLKTGDNRRAGKPPSPRYYLFPLIFILLMGAFTTVQAASYMMPKITSSQWLPENMPPSHLIEFTAQASAQSWTPPKGMTTSMTDLWVVICEVNKPCNGNLPAFNVGCAYGVTAACVKEFNNKVAGTHSARVSYGSSGTESCLMIMAQSNSAGYDWIGQQCNPGIETPKPPPVVDWCGIGTSSVIIDFGTLTSTEAPGKAKSESFSVTCEGSPRYYYKLQTGSSISLSNGMTAGITVDGYPLGTTLTGTAGTTTHTVTATLAGTPNSAGAFSGSGVLLAAYP